MGSGRPILGSFRTLVWITFFCTFWLCLGATVGTYFGTKSAQEAQKGSQEGHQELRNTENLHFQKHKNIVVFNVFGVRGHLRQSWRRKEAPKGYWEHSKTSINRQLASWRNPGLNSSEHRYGRRTLALVTTHNHDCDELSSKPITPALHRYTFLGGSNRKLKTQRLAIAVHVWKNHTQTCRFVSSDITR